jgi:DNA-binding CsgD family transcriptional regulator
MVSNTRNLEYGQLLHSIYTGPRQSPPWTDFLTNVKKQTGSDVAVIAFGSRSQMARVNYVNGTDHEDYKMPFLALSPFTQVPVGEATILEDFFSEKDLLRSDFYRVCLKSINIRHMIGLNFYNQNDQLAYLRLGRSERGSAYNKTDRDFFRLLFPHFHTISEMINELQLLHFQRNILHELLGKFGLGIIVTDRLLHVKAFNETASSIVRGSTSLRLSGSRLQLRDRALSQAVKGLLGNENCNQRRQFHLRAGGDDIRLTIRPHHQQDQGWKTHDICFYLSDQHSEISLSERSLSEIYGLTPREASMASLLVKGLTIDEISQRGGITRNTAYTHIKAIFSKLGVSQQSSVFNKLLASPAILN